MAGVFRAANKGRWLLGVLLFLLLPGTIPLASPNAERAYDEAKEQYLHLRSDPSQIDKRQNWLKVIASFEDVTKRYPKDPNASDAQYTVAKLYQELYVYSHKRDDLEAALDVYRNFVKKYPDSHLADDALYEEAAILWKNLEEPKPAQLALEKLIANYPESDYLRRAQVLLASLPPEIRNEEMDKVTAEGDLGVFRTQAIVVEVIDADRLRVTIPVPTNVQIQQVTLKNRIFFDLRGMQIPVEAREEKPPTVNHKTLEQIRVGQFSPTTVRVVFDTKDFKSFNKKRLKDPDRLEVELSRLAAPDENVVAQNTVNKPKTSKSTSKGHAKSKNGEIEEWNEKTRPVRMIAIDPGHGGDDPGAIGPGGTMEKNISLQIARKLKEELETTLGVKAFLTRNEDVYVPLEERTKIANEKGADLFISIHCNAHANRKMTGIQTFFLDTIKDQYSRKLAARENAMSMEKMSNLEMILLDLSNKENHDLSSKFAGLVQHQMLKQMRRKFNHVNDLGVHTAVFVVLFYAEMPSVLVETSFLSNRQEEKRLKDADYQLSLARSITQGVKDYIVQKDRIVGTL